MLMREIIQHKKKNCKEKKDFVQIFNIFENLKLGTLTIRINKENWELMKIMN